MSRAGVNLSLRACEAISPFCHREARSDLAFPEPATRKERLPRCARNDIQGCHREGRSDLAFPWLANGQRRDCRATLALGCHREGRRDLALDRQQTGKREIASQARFYLSSRGTKRSRLSSAGKQSKERLLRRLAMTRQRHEAISIVQGGQTEK